MVNHSKCCGPMDPQGFLKGPQQLATTLPLKKRYQYHLRWRKTLPPLGATACCCTNSKSCRDKSTPQLAMLEDRTHLQTAGVGWCRLMFFPNKNFAMFFGRFLSGWFFERNYLDLEWLRCFSKRHPSLGVGFCGGIFGPMLSQTLWNSVSPDP